MGVSISKIPVTTSPAAKARAAAALRKPLYVSPDTANFKLYFDAKTTPANPAIAVTVPDVAGTTLPQPTQSGNALGLTNGQTIAYTASVVTANDVTYYQISANADLLPGAHTLGVVLQAADGFVLSEAQNSYLLTGGPACSSSQMNPPYPYGSKQNPGASPVGVSCNAPATVYLKAVADSAFLCDAACDGQEGSATPSGAYAIEAFVSDHEGDTMGWQKDANGNALPLDNGPYSIVENDDGFGANSGIVSITSSDTGTAGPFTDGGSDNALPANGSGVGNAGHNILVQCLKVGTTTISTQLAKTSPAAGPVIGFDYATQIDTTKDPVNASLGTPFDVTQTNVYTTPGQYIGTVPTYQDWGNQLAVSCDASLNLTFE